ncbi:hypothetical protein [Cupriavidus alkaliphilus]|uniref:hypothetical protein n=1 Tax=Cupriavidus alkaliphilus TaxID=942866 RepID=UPI0011BDAA84|nr:hypothetical protein [Cupriavidus alkaliphilus]
MLQAAKNDNLLHLDNLPVRRAQKMRPRARLQRFPHASHRGPAAGTTVVPGGAMKGMNLHGSRWPSEQFDPIAQPLTASTSNRETSCFMAPNFVVLLEGITRGVAHPHRNKPLQILP